MKSKGGRAKKASYTTVVMRIPTPVKEEVQRLVNKFYETVIVSEETAKAVTSIESNPIKPVTDITSKETTKPVTSKRKHYLNKLNLDWTVSEVLRQHKIFSAEDLFAMPDWQNTLMQHKGIGQVTVRNLDKRIRDKWQKFREIKQA